MSSGSMTINDLISRIGNMTAGEVLYALFVVACTWVIMLGIIAGLTALIERDRS